MPRLEPSANWPLSGFLSARPLKFIGLSDVPSDCPVRQRSNGQLRPTVDCTTARTVCSTRSQKIVCDDRSHQTVWCATGLSSATRRHKTSTVNNSKPQQSTDMALTRLSGGPSTATTGIVVGAINTPNHHHSSNPSFSLFSFNTRAKNTLQRHNQSI
jgi:hypothetical protein